MTGYGGNYTIPAGYHNGLGMVKSVVTIPQVTSLTATAGNTTIAVAWKNPSRDFTGTMIRYKADAYPTSVTDGAQAYNGSASSCILSGLANGTTYYVRAFTYVTFGGKTEYNTATSGTQAAAAPYLPKGQQVFTSSGSFMIPAGITSIEVFCVGGGGAGSHGYTGRNSDDDRVAAPGGGGGGGYTKTGKFAVTPGTAYSVVVGAGGTSSTSTSGDGGSSSFGSLLMASGGLCVLQPTSVNSKLSEPARPGGAGGSGGGASYLVGLDSSYNPGAGGADGKDGERTIGINQGAGGAGQGTTTRAFAESSNTLYAGGGGGANGYPSTKAEPGAGGAGGGGRGGYYVTSPYINGEDGSANTGGGGGGGASHVSYGINAPGGKGGSGVVIVRWGY